ncbi:MAG TPA: 1-acyl-sn-glycerol-3-phosphate acyltransferase [Candidatus Binatia bacterium]|nr:1-acyl-sn-glycerol-3-phosphate acyltransferase [Candidatus Binatia bacterium]
MGNPGGAAEKASQDGAATGLPITPHPSSMSQRLGWIHWLLSRYAFAFVHVDPRFVERVRQLAARGAVVYVMRNRSVADYLLIRALFLRERLPLPEFANDLAIGWFRPLRWIFARIVERLSRLQFFGQRKRQRVADRETAIRLVRVGLPILIFLRARASGLFGIFRPERARESKRIGDPYLEEVLAIAAERPVFLVPLALFRGRGYRKRNSRLATLVYSVQEAPNELKKLLTFLFNRRDLSLTIGEAIDLRQFLGRYAAEGSRSMVRRLTRALRLFLYREERVVWGPPLVPKRVIRARVIDRPGLQKTIERVAAERAVPVEKIRREAEGYFDEMAANFNGTYFALLAFVFRLIWDRIFRGVEITGLDRVAERIREHPIVLVPCHRSHFDYLILSHIFHSQFLSPPHIAAGINMSFFPLGMLFRGAGAFFIRRSFGDNELYKAVFREYLTYLIREGYTQEFFIEGGRSRTGKILTPKLGMLSAIVNAFLRGVRRDLYLVPVSITYERLVEEEAYKRELLGAEKEKESLLALLRARSVLRANYGKSFVDFAEPISLARALGGLRERFQKSSDDPAVEEETRHFILKLGFRLLADVNAASVVSAPSLAATVLLSNPYPAIRVGDFLRSAHFLLDHAERLGARLTGSLRQDRRTFQETLAFLETSGLVARIADRDGGILHVPDEKRINLDFYKNNSIHWFLVLSLVAHALARGVSRDALKDDLWWWLELFRNEFVVPEREELAARVGELLDSLAALGVIRDGAVERTHPLIRSSASILQNFREAYWVATTTLRTVDASGKAEKALVEEMRRTYRANLLLGVLRKPEGNTTVALENAINRLQELRYVAFDARGRGNRWVVPGRSHAELAEIESRLAESVAEPAPRG